MLARFILKMFTPANSPIPKTKDELFVELLRSQLDELNRKVDEADAKLKREQQKYPSKKKPSK